jgi:hypothetical protein
MEGFTEIYAADVIKDQPENFTGVEVCGVRGTGAMIGTREEVEVDNEQPQFFSAYVRYTDGKAAAIADFSAHAQAAQYGKQLAERYATHNWTFTDQFAAAHH